MFTIAIATTLSALALTTLPVRTQDVQAQAVPKQIDCQSLPGAGSFWDPIRIGAVDQTVVLVGCPALTAGDGYNHIYYSFDLIRPAPSGAIVGTSFIRVPGATSAVHPRLATSGGVTLLSSRRNGAWFEQPPATMRYLPIEGLPAGRYMLGAEKLGSPLGSLQTPSFNILIVLPS